MKQSIVILACLTTVVSAGVIGAIASVGTSIAGAIKKKKNKGKRDFEYEDALLVIRDRTIQQWDKAVWDPASISPEMIEALKARGYSPPTNIQGEYKPSAAEAKLPPHEAMTKTYALESIKAGHPIPPTVLQHMGASGWSGPGLPPSTGGPALTRRDAFEKYLATRELNEEYLAARDLDDEYLYYYD